MATFRPTLGDVIAKVTGMLGDNDPAAPNTRWTVLDLVGYINEAMRELLARRPEAFAATLEYPLQWGALQQLPDEFQTLVTIEESVNGQDRVPVTEADYKYARIFKRRTITLDPAGDPLGTFQIATYTIHPVDSAIFYVEPPVPVGATVKVRATMIRRHYLFTDKDTNKSLRCMPEYEPQVVDWVMYRALSRDHESATAREQAKIHHDAFQAALENKGRSKERVAAAMEDREGAYAAQQARQK